jgi:hypothetical protein
VKNLWINCKSGEISKRDKHLGFKLSQGLVFTLGVLESAEGLATILLKAIGQGLNVCFRGQLSGIRVKSSTVKKILNGES